jgi:hypothetical protein
LARFRFFEVAHAAENLIESDHAVMRLLGYRQRFRSPRSAKAPLSGIGKIEVSEAVVEIPRSISA